MRAMMSPQIDRNNHPATGSVHSPLQAVPNSSFWDIVKRQIHRNISQDRDFTMKGLFFQQPLEFRIEVAGEEWRQAGQVAGTMQIKNRSETAVAVGKLYLHLACGTKKKVQQKADDAFSMIASAPLEAPESLAGGETARFAFDFSLDQNCVVSDNQQSLYLVCGQNATETPAGHLQLNILPHRDVEAVTSLLETYFSFVLKGQKSKKEWVESKLIPPSGGGLVTLEQLLLLSSFDGDVLHLTYQFRSKGLAATATSLNIKKGKKEFKQKLAASDYIVDGQFIDNEVLLRNIREALATVDPELAGAN